MARPKEGTKGEELKTYRALGLSRAHKFVRERKRMERIGIYRVIGGDHADRPFITVRSKAYWETRMAVTEELLQRGETLSCEIPIGVLLDSLQPKIEAETYLRMIQQAGAISDQRLATVMGRKVTAEEKRELQSGNPARGYETYRAALIDEVLAQVETHQQRNPNRLQEIWRETVGEFANESGLEKIENGVAYVRSVNRALAFELARRTDLPKRLTEKSGQPVKRVRVF